MSQLSFSRPFGFMSTRTDVGAIISTANSRQNYFSIIGVMPWLHPLLDHEIFTGVIPRSLAGKMTVQETTTRRAQEEKAKEPFSNNDDEKHPGNPPQDFLGHFLDIQKSKPEKIDDLMVMVWVMNNVVAGTDTVAMAINAVIYHTLQDSSIHSALLVELHACSPPEITSYAHLRRLPYLSAIITEALRLFPMVNIPMERVVPAEGLYLRDGRFVPGGFRVLMSAWVVHHDEGIFGRETDAFRPERWMRGEGEGDEEFKERVRRMRGAWVPFSYGRRSCIGECLLGR